MASPFELKVRIRGADKLRLALSNPQVIQGPLTRFLERSAQVVEGRAKEKSPVDTGRLRSSISRRIEPARKRAVVGTKVRYARRMEFGQRPAGKEPREWPDPNQIRRWAVRHGIPAERSHLVARKIWFKGIKARPYLLPALGQSRGDIKEFMGRMAREVEQEFGRRAR